MKDFFGEYNRRLRSGWLASGTVALIFSLGITSLLMSSSLSGLQADVRTAGKGVKYDADLNLVSRGSARVLIFGSEAQDVDQIYVTVLADPEKLESITSNDPNVKIESNLEGVYAIVIDVHQASLSPGKEIANFHVVSTGNTGITLTDSSFTSGSGVYSLTNSTR